MKSMLSRVRELIFSLPSHAKTTWFRYRALPKKWQFAIAGALALLLIGLIVLANVLGEKPDDNASNERAVTLASIGSLSGNGDSVSIIGSVRSVTEANILAQSGGTVRSVRTSIGATVPAGYVIAELENAAERAAVLQAEGSYDAAVAARNAVSPADPVQAARNAVRSAFISADTALETQADLFFGGPGATGPALLIRAAGTGEDLSRERKAIDTMMDSWRMSVDLISTKEPESALSEAETNLRRISTFLNNLWIVANANQTDADPADVAELSAARATINAQLAAISSAREAYRNRSVSTTASVDAGVKQALGSLRAAQANLERTIVRAPIGGTVNFLPIRVGDYVTSLTHVATVAQNGALEIVMYVSEADRELLAAGSRVTVEDNYSGIVTAIAPALDPNTKQIEVRVAVEGATELVNGQTVRIALPNTVARPEAAVSGPIALPLASVKLRGEERFVFTVGEDGRLVAQKVEVGDVRGDRIEVLSPLSPDMRIVTDARGLAEGERVRIAP